jgi:alpha-mannosidase
VGPDGAVSPGFVQDGEATFLAKGVPPMGYAVYHLLPDVDAFKSPFEADGSKITTPYYDLEIGEDGSLSRAYDKANAREVLPEGARGNVLQFFEDKPHNWEAWDIEPQYQEKVWEAAVVEPLKVVERTAHRLTLAVKLAYGASTLDQTITLYAHTPRIDFNHAVDWHERKTLLKVAFPAEIRSSRATYEIAYGAVERPTHWNTSWDWAKFEVNGHKWADLSEAGYGVSVLNDCKYGWDVRENVIRLSLLRSPQSPDPEADQGAHLFTYSLFPHAGDWKDGTVQEGFDLNVPFLTVAEDAHAGDWGASRSFVAIDKPNVIVDAMKKAEDSGDLILRTYEAYGGRGTATISFDGPVSSVTECDLLEEGDAPVKTDGASFSFEFKPFEVKTFKVKF